MTDPCAVLIEPKDGDPLGLLAEGPCGARPPTASKAAGAAVGFPYESHPWRPGVSGASSRRALVLAWNGKPVADGLDRLSRAVGWNPLDTNQINWWPMEDIALAASKFGTVVLLDAEGQEI